MDRTIYTVGQINAYIQSMMDDDRLLSGLCIRGEISNYKMYPSGHHYFSLKDETGAIRCVMFKSSAMRLRFRPENGMKVIAVGRVSVYPRDGAYQLYCNGLMPDGKGDLQVAFEQLKARLMAQGLFDPEHKKPLPQFPKRIAIITSPSGAAVHDMLRILGRRYPLVSVRILPVRVQGAEAPGEIAAAIDYANRWDLADLIITGRGGGSMEDLWAFNEEIVAQSIYRSRIPVISAVGHEPDVTISDYVADLRAATPSNGAELAVPDKSALLERLENSETALKAALTRQLRTARQHLERLASSRCLRKPVSPINDRRQILDGVYKELSTALERKIARCSGDCARLTASLEALSPLKVLSRGYALVKTTEGVPVRSVVSVKPDQWLEITLSDGVLETQVNAITAHKGGN